MALIENIQREDLNPLEEARALERLIAEFGLTHQQAADAVGRSRAAVSNLLRLLELPPEVCDAAGGASWKWAMPERCSACRQRRQQIEVAALVAKKGLSVRETESSGAPHDRAGGDQAGDGAAGAQKIPMFSDLKRNWRQAGRPGQHPACGPRGRGKVIRLQ